MFRREVQSIRDLIMRNLRVQGLETPLLQKRLIESWPEVAGDVVSKYTLELSIYNQTLYVRISIPALRQNLSFRRQELVNKLNAAVGAMIITDIRFN